MSTELRRIVVLHLCAACAGIAIATGACGIEAASHPGAPVPPSTSISGGGGGARRAQISDATVPAVLSVLPNATESARAPAVPALPAPSPAIPESRRLTLEYPATIRAGDSDVVRLTLAIDVVGGATPTVEISGNPVTPDIVNPTNLYDTHNVVAEADLDLAGMDFNPGGPVSEPLLPGEPVTLRWSVHPTGPGTYRGTAWLFLVFTDKVTGAQSREAISAQPIEIQVTTLFGLGGGAARLTGGLGLAGGSLLGFPFLADLLRCRCIRMRGRS